MGAFTNQLNQIDPADIVTTGAADGALDLNVKS
jgi:hypothetical protein